MDAAMSLKPNLELSVATAQAIVDQTVLKQAVATISRLHGGEISAVYEIAFADHAHPPLVLKVYPDELHWKMQKELTVVGLIRDRLSVSIPRILLADDSKRLLGLNLTLMTKLEGSILGQLETTLDSAQRLSAYAQIGRLLREFHCISMEAFGYLGPNGIWTAHSTNHQYLTHQFQRKLKEFAERGGNADLAKRVSQHFADRAELFSACTRAVLCHNDLHAGNLLATVSNGRLLLTGVLDFEGALAGDPLMDVAKALYYLDAEARRALLDGYGAMDRKHWLLTLDLYHLYFVLELWCWMAQIGNRQPLDQLALDLERYSAA
ncbi:aminoglycoside phosphotransferase family protein [Bradyrhizobium sp. Arg237L]|uniref:phosphotransferase family protein n=1 Tax=Bradyrhizobium sp. Arg237L TaxID=3003352 RepID=UPI00249EB074|nr:aminoglycoside phosphotransferase family protein [Bradyrhizobium sp. Arg237L]MDI4232916.1 aminoglycoside phosphotransferase family protein [Bradyrhizobium sp. Arg237L]